MFDEAFVLAAHASELAPGFLPASDAVILIGQLSGHRDKMDAEIKIWSRRGLGQTDTPAAPMAF
ncbi:hypothetical protein [Tabrizicola sp.]|uniref:hypothetical protein n=1 Tax=Tabrizicola sp. TaxID=2005166 RepID=UPI00286D4A4B|nr:hypothetical protein [Tabrizicola sp.]